MTETEHKTTWEVKHCPRGGEPSYDIIDRTGDDYVTVGSVWSEAQASLIVRAVNSHAALEEAQL